MVRRSFRRSVEFYRMAENTFAPTARRCAKGAVEGALPGFHVSGTVRRLTVQCPLNPRVERGLLPVGAKVSLKDSRYTGSAVRRHPPPVRDHAGNRHA